MPSSVAVRAASPRQVRSSFAELLHPVVQLRTELIVGWNVAIDRREARRRVRAGRPAFDPIDVLQAAGDLRLPFRRATQAFVRTGLASPDAALAAHRELGDEILALGASWVAGEPLPRQEPRRLAQRAAGLVAGALLARVATSIRTVVRLAPADRASCPACGGPPEFATRTAQGRRLTCARCDTTWSTGRRGCLGCEAHDAPTLFRIPSPDLGYALIVCNGCGRYLKERTGRGAAELVVERALTTQLDAAAERRGLRL